MSYSKEKQAKLVSSLTNVGSLVGDNSQGISNGVQGLGMSLEQTRCDDEAKAVRDGLFKVAVMGTFSSGKSTVINALIGSKILPESALPCTAILTFIQYGNSNDENRAEVYMADEFLEDGSVKTGECHVMKIEEFQEEYKYTTEDEKECKLNGSVARFAKVKYAVMYCSKPLMEGGVTIIDSPGLEDKQIATDLALKVAQEAQAIIYVTLDRGFSKADKEYISATFHDCPNNVFFLLNRMDMIGGQNERKAALDRLKQELIPIFTDKNGVFNEGLCDRRLFGISALRALDARRGITLDNETEEERTLTAEERKTKFEKSWFGPFEKELETFLTTDEKCVAQYQKCFTQMASSYRNAKKQVDDFINAYENNIRLDEQKRAEYDTIVADIRRSIELNEKAFDNCSLKIQNTIAEVLDGCAASIDKSWEQDMSSLAAEVDINTLEYMLQGLKQINPLASRESKVAKMEEFSGKILTVVSDYFVKKVETYIADNKVVIDAEVEECQKQLNVSLNGTENLFGELTNIIKTQPEKANASDKNWLQITISGLLGDYSAALKGSVDGKSTWVEFLKKTIFNTLWQTILMSLIDGGIGVIIAICIEYLQGSKNKGETIKKLLISSKDGIVRTIREKNIEIRHRINNQIAVTINEKKETESKAMKQKLDDEIHKLDSICAAINDQSFNLDSEKNRFSTILSAIYTEAHEAYSVVFEKELNMVSFEAL